MEEINVRFFIYEENESSEELEITEVEESVFLETSGEIEYERNTIFLNGCRQICLTKTNSHV